MEKNLLSDALQSQKFSTSMYNMAAGECDDPQLRATLNSLAMLNVANVLNERKRLEKLAKKQEKNIFKTDFEYFDDDEFGQEFLDEIDEFENSSV